MWIVGARCIDICTHGYFKQCGFDMGKVITTLFSNHCIIGFWEASMFSSPLVLHTDLTTNPLPIAMEIMGSASITVQPNPLQNPSQLAQILLCKGDDSARQHVMLL